jgi:hypothetical protein
VLVGIDLDPARLAPAKAGREREAELAALRLGIAGGDATLARLATWLGVGTLVGGIVESVIMLLVATVIVVNLLVDLSYAIVDPRLRIRQ